MELLQSFLLLVVKRGSEELFRYYSITSLVGSSTEHFYVRLAIV